MNFSVTIFDIDQSPLPNQPVDLLQNGRVLARATTDARGVATFAVPFASSPGLSIRSSPDRTG